MLGGGDPARLFELARAAVGVNGSAIPPAIEPLIAELIEEASSGAAPWAVAMALTRAGHPGRRERRAHRLNIPSQFTIAGEGMPTTALLEREAELDTIESLLAAAGSGSGQLLTIEGEAGAGKTSLLEATGRLANERGMRVLRARGGEYERDFPYGVVRQLFEPMLLFDEAWRAELLAGSAALAAPVFDLQAARREDTDPLAIQHGLYWLTADLAASSPTVLLVDDAQWADLASLRAFVYAGRRLEGLSMLVAFTVRTGEPGGHEELIDQLRGQPTASLVEPAPLSARAAQELAAAEVGARPSEQFAGACREATAGNPFLLVQLLRSLDGAQLDSSPDCAGGFMEKATAGISRSIISRLRKLGEHSVTVARAVAVLEPNAETRLVGELAGLAEDVVAESFELLIRARLLSDSRPVAFAHPLVREVVLSEVATPRRAADHSRAARLLDRDSTDPDAVAAHLLLAEHGGEAWVGRSPADGRGRGARARRARGGGPLPAPGAARATGPRGPAGRQSGARHRPAAGQRSGGNRGAAHGAGGDRGPGGTRSAQYRTRGLAWVAGRR